MSVTLELPEELESELANKAAALDLSLTDYIQRLLFGARTAEAKPKTGAELVSYWRSERLIGSRPDISNSQTHARQLRERAERRTFS
jgi:hypothetical protein